MPSPLGLTEKEPSQPKKWQKEKTQQLIDALSDCEELKSLSLEHTTNIEHTTNTIRTMRVIQEQLEAEMREFGKKFADHKEEVEEFKKTIADHKEELEKSKKAIADHKEEEEKSKKAIANHKKEVEELRTAVQAMQMRPQKQ